MIGQLFHFSDMINGRVLRCHGNDLVVHGAAVDHLHIADHIRFDQAKRMDGLGTKYQYIQRVAILSQRLWNKTIIDRVLKGGINLSRPVALSTSYFEREPCGISINAFTVAGAFSP